MTRERVFIQDEANLQFVYDCLNISKYSETSDIDW